MKKTLLFLFIVFIIHSTMSAQDIDKQTTLKSSLRKNSFYIENIVIFPTINYDRIFPLNNSMGLVLKVGIFYYAGIYLETEASLLFGDMKHFFEIGGGWGAKDMFGLYGRMGYRYIGEKGLMLKGGINYVKNVPVFPSIGIGFSF